MGGGRRFEYPKYVWSPAGGWWANPKNWRINTAAYLAFSAVVAFNVYQYTQPRIKAYPRKEPAISKSSEHSHH